jgi:hypothetical protein
MTGTSRVEIFSPENKELFRRSRFVYSVCLYLTQFILLLNSMDQHHHNLLHPQRLNHIVVGLWHPYSHVQNRIVHKNHRFVLTPHSLDVHPLLNLSNFQKSIAWRSTTWAHCSTSSTPVDPLCRSHFRPPVNYCWLAFVPSITVAPFWKWNRATRRWPSYVGWTTATIRWTSIVPNGRRTHAMAF